MRSATTHLSCALMVATPLIQGRAWVWSAAAMRLHLTLRCVRCSLCDAFCHTSPIRLPASWTHLPVSSSFSSGKAQGAGAMFFSHLVKDSPRVFSSPQFPVCGAPGTVWLVSRAGDLSQGWAGQTQVTETTEKERSHPIRRWRTCPGVGWSWQEAKPTYQPLFATSTLSPLTSLFAVFSQILLSAPSFAFCLYPISSTSIFSSGAGPLWFKMR